MAGAKETPRQKMIGMMYLVLTAMLALNVSREVLNSFILINNSLETTNQNFENKNASQYAAFDKAYGLNPDKVRNYYEDAKEVKVMADSLVEYIEDLKRHLIIKTDNKDPEKINPLIEGYKNAETPEERAKYKAELDSIFSLSNVDNKKDYDRATNIMIGDDAAKPKEGEWTAHELKSKIDAYRDRLVTYIDAKKYPALVESVVESFNTDTVFKLSDTETANWSITNFYHIPIVAVITNLSKMQTDVMNAESDVVKYLYSQVDAEDFKFDTLAAKVIAPTSYVLLGEEYTADVFVAAFSTTQNPTVKIGEVDTSTYEIVGTPDTSSIKVDKGVGKYTVKATSEGLKKWGGIIEMQTPSGEIRKYPFESQYMVAKPTAVVSPTKMNVFYIGVDNPVSISAPGVAAENLSPSISNGSIRAVNKSAGEYVVTVKGGKEAIVSVAAELDGERTPMGKSDFRVKRVPDPKPFVAGQEGGLISKAKLVAAGAVIPKMENFDFDLNFRVTSFEMVMNINGDLFPMRATGNRFTPEMIGNLKNVRRNSRVYIEEIRAVGPDNVPRKLSPISFKIQ